MKLVTYRDAVGQGRAGVWRDDAVFDAAALLGRGGDAPLPLTDLLRLGAGALDDLRGRLAAADPTGPAARPARLGDLLAPIPQPPTVRDFYAFEAHVKAARARRGLAMLPEWYEYPVFYFSNPSAIQGPESDVLYPYDTQEMDFELEIACVVGREGRDLSADEAGVYIAGYTILNDWSLRDIWRNYEAKLSMGPAKAKDYATSLGPWLVTPDELADRRSGSGAGERYDLTMTATVNGREISRGNSRDLQFSFQQMLAHASRHVTLRVGDVVGSGTVGTGCILELGTDVQPWLQPGNVVELAIERLGTLRNAIVMEAGR